MNDAFDVLMFDLGGVLVELGGVSDMLHLTNDALSADELWRQWLRSPTGRAFESGRMDPSSFAQGMVEEFQLSISPEAFLQRFSNWLGPLSPGALDLLDELSGRYPLACLSNTNALHWTRMADDMELGRRFDYAFPSHRTGRVNPDLDAFLHPLESMGVAAARVLYFDDHPLNVEAAARAGLRAFRVNGAAAVRDCLVRQGVSCQARRR